jgi:DNA-directed RNA polymerase subunit RPC12/RpoP
MQRQEIVLIDGTHYHFACPNCQSNILVKRHELNCRIFRCGIYKHSFEQINPHLPKEDCERLKKEDAIFGCGKPFEIIEHESKFYVVVCEYK